jgi:7,8-dihydropterin-6-yl-methyl-4-(beta-D-ribofuranosyl)aminobenzene 5'-phosphate synthase
MYMDDTNNVTITILADNTATPPFRAEHGFSALVETREPGGSASTILFDTGMGAVFDNAVAAGVDLACVSDVVLSHGHYDHTDALATFLARYPSVRIHASYDIFRDHYSLRTGTCRKISLSEENRRVIASLPSGSLCVFGKEDSIPGTRINLAGAIPRANPYESPSPLLFGDSGCSVPDEVPDEIVLWFESVSGLVILTGCCHAGFVNTCEYVRAHSGIDKIHAVIGGFHLAHVSEKRLQAAADYIERRQIERVVACHCTGDDEINWLRTKLGSIVEKGVCGVKIAIPMPSGD